MVKKTVFYFVPKSGLIKFKEDDDSLLVAENSVTDVLKNGDVVEVEIGEVEVTKDDKTTKEQRVTKLVKIEGEAEPKKEEPKETAKPEETEPTKAPVVITKDLTIEALYNNESVRFKEEDLNGFRWTKVSKKIAGQDFLKQGLKAGNKVNVTVTDKILTAFKVLEEGKKEETQTARKTSYRDEDSTDKRTASMNAKDVVVALIDKGSFTTEETMEKAIINLTKLFYETTKNL